MDEYDFDSLANMDIGGMDFGGLEGLDLSGLEGLDSIGLDGALTKLKRNRLLGLENLDFGNMDLGGMDLGAIENLDLSGLENLDFGNMDLGGMDLGVPKFGSNFDLGSFEDLKTADYLNDMFGTGGQNLGSSVDMDKSMEDFSTNLTDIMDNRGGFTSQWQQAGTDRIMVNDDGTGIGINENGEPYALSVKDVGDMIKTGQLNTFGSSYNTATGGNKIAPGGGSAVTLKNGQSGQLLTTGKVIDTTTGKIIGTKDDVKNVITQDGDGNKIVKEVDRPPGTPDKPGTPNRPSTPTTPTKGDLGSLLPLLLALLAMNKGGGGGGSGAVIPGLTATQKQTPYAQQQRAPGYRPGQGGISYFDQTQYAPKMAAGGIARLLDGPGDGVSDSIPAVIDGGMAGGGQPAKVARGEYIIDARTVAALGNGSTDAGAERLDKMRQNILRDDRKAGVGKDSKAYRHLMA